MSAEKLDPDNLEENADYLKRLSGTGNLPAIAAHIGVSLLRIAMAQEKLVALSELDLEGVVESEIASRAETRAAEIAQEKTRRSFIGKK